MNFMKRDRDETARKRVNVAKVGADESCTRATAYGDVAGAGTGDDDAAAVAVAGTGDDDAAAAADDDAADSGSAIDSAIADFGWRMTRISAIWYMCLCAGTNANGASSAGTWSVW